jgi:hypothetical protein
LWHGTQDWGRRKSGCFLKNAFSVKIHVFTIKNSMEQILMEQYLLCCKLSLNSAILWLLMGMGRLESFGLLKDHGF